MPWRLVALVGSLSFLILFAGAGPAAATTYCVTPATGCGGGDLPTISDALIAAYNNTGADDVRLGAATYTDGPWGYVDGAGTNPVTIRGAGQHDSRLVSFAAGPTLTLVNGSADNLLVYPPATGATKVSLSLTLGKLSNSQVLTATNGQGVVASAATVDHSSIVSSGSSSTGNLGVLADNSKVLDTQMSTTNGVEVLNPPVAVRRSTIVTKGHGLQSVWNGTEISDTQIVLDDSTAVGVQGICDIGIGTITIDATNLTVTGGGSGTAFESIGGQFCGGNVSASSSLVQGVGTTAKCTPGAQPGASASVTIGYSDANLAGGAVTGTCSATVDAGTNFFADPKLASLAPLQPIPRFDSPLVDAGDPTAPGVGQPTDLGGLPRAVNGRRDIGAFEYGRRAPLLDVTRDPATVPTDAPVSFNATTSDPDLGDTVAVAWSFDDGETATGTAANHAFATVGEHTATATATDSAGVTTTRSATVMVTDITAPQTSISRHPKKSGKKPKAVFVFSSSEAGGSFECTLDKGAPAPCTSPYKQKVKAGKKPKKPKKHLFTVVAIDAAGNRDATPATYAWKVKKKPKKG